MSHDCTCRLDVAKVTVECLKGCLRGSHFALGAGNDCSIDMRTDSAIVSLKFVRHFSTFFPPLSSAPDVYFTNHYNHLSFP